MTVIPAWRVEVHAKGCITVVIIALRDRLSITSDCRCIIPKVVIPYPLVINVVISHLPVVAVRKAVAAFVIIREQMNPDQGLTQLELARLPALVKGGHLGIAAHMDPISLASIVRVAISCVAVL